MSDEDIFLAAVEIADPADRAAYLDRACGADAAVRRKVERLLAAHFKSGEFLDEPVLRQLSSPPGDDNESGALGPAEEQEPAEEPDYLPFLEPPAHPGSLGRLGPYEVSEVLGRGGFGIVFRAFDDQLQRVIAIKMLAPCVAATSPARKRFLREARLSAQVRHGNVVQVYAVKEQPLPFLVMEFVSGETLQQRLDRTGPLEPAEIVRIGRQIAEGLAAAHATGLIHRDVKPGNILIEAGEREQVKLTDFGLARTADDASLTRSGVLAGTPMFMAPEQARGEALDHRADLFSLGSVLYTLASGRPPFRAATTYAVLRRVVEDAPRPIREVIPEVPPWLCDVISRLQAKKPEERFQSAREVANLLTDYEARLEANAEFEQPAPVTPGPLATGRSRKWIAAAAVLFLLILTVAEFASPTRLFRRQETGPNQTGGDPAPNAWTESKAKDKGDVPAEEPDRRAAEYVLSVNGAVEVNGEKREVKNLPREPFRLTGVVLWNADGNRVAMTDDRLTVFNDCNNITYIRTFATKLGVVGLANFRGCTNLTLLSLERSSVTDEGLAAFKGCKGLLYLRVSYSPLTDAALGYVGDYKNLTELHLPGTLVTDAGLARLTGLTKLTELHLYQAKVTAKGVEELAKALPKCRIRWDGGIIQPTVPPDPE